MNNTNPEALFAHATALHDAGNIAAAAEAYHQLLLMRWPNEQLLFLFGTAQLQLGNTEDGVLLLTTFLEVFPGHPEATSNLAAGLQSLGRHEEALARYDAVIAAAPHLVKAHNNRANILCALDRDEEALLGYERAIALAPDFVEAAFNRARTLARLGRTDEAQAAAEHILTQAPDYAPAMTLRGEMLAQKGAFAAAIDSFRAALHHTHDDGNAHVGLANALSEEKRFAESLPHYRAALTQNPNAADVWNNLGNAFTEIGDTERALPCFHNAVTLDPNLHQAVNNLGNILGRMGRHEEAIAQFTRATEMAPDVYSAWNNRGNAYLALHKNEQALADYDRAIACDPNIAQTLANRAAALIALVRPAEALQATDAALAKDETYGEAWSIRGTALLDLARPQEALAALDRAVALDPANANYRNNRAMALKGLGRIDEGLAQLQNVLDDTPEMPQAMWNAAILTLLKGDLEQGWPLFEWRWKGSILTDDMRTFDVPMWQGQDVTGKSILLHAEQGFGDTIQFCRFATHLSERGAHVLLDIPVPLNPLLETLAGNIRILKTGDTVPPYDYHCPMMSLPLGFSTRLDTIPAHVPYLSVLPQRRARWRDLLGERRHARRIGLCWSGRASYAPDLARSIALHTLAPIWSQDAEFHAVQKDIRPADAAFLTEHTNIVAHDAEIEDFGDTAALIEQMDLVISVDTSVAHVAGALGKPVWIMIGFSPDWRWLMGREDSPWYPTARLLRQTQPGDWDTVAQTAGETLRGWNAS